MGHKAQINIKRNNQRFSHLPHPQTLFTQWCAYAQGQYQFIKTQPTITVKSAKKRINQIEYELDLLQALADHFRDLDFTARHHHAYP